MVERSLVCVRYYLCLCLCCCVHPV